ncbi:MAG: methionyl-tRNA formyltransferase, partial [Clostridiales bacterium]
MRIVFMGSPDFAVPCLERLLKEKDRFEVVAVITQPDRAKGRKRVLTPTPIKEVAQAAGLPLWQPEKINTPESVENIRAYRPDILVVVAFGQILKQELLQLAPYGAINVHASLLPAYRGAAPVHWALIKGEKITGITTMFLNAGMDTGNIIFKKELLIQDKDNTGILYNKLADMGQDLLIETLDAIEAGQAPSLPQNNEEATYAALLKKEHEILLWDKSPQAICNQIRGLYPWPIAYTLWHGRRWKLGHAYIYEEESHYQPGEIIEILPDGLRVAAAGGSVCLD